MPYAFNPKTLKIRYADKSSKLGKGKSIKIFHTDDEFRTFMNAFLEKQEKEANTHIQALNDITCRIEKIRTQLNVTRGSDA